MRAKYRRPLSLLTLEDRVTPAASVQLTGGSLFIRGDNTANVIQVTGSSPNLNVLVNDVNLGTYAVTGKLNITTGNSNDTVRLFLTGTLSSDVSISTGNGLDSILVDGAGVEGTISGKLAIQQGAGNDLTDLGGQFGLTVQGPLTIDGGVGIDNAFAGIFLGVAPRPSGIAPKQLSLGEGLPPQGNGFLVVNGNTTLTNVNFFQTDARTTGATQFNGLFLMNYAAEGTDGGFFPDDTTFGGDVTVIGGAGSDNFTPIFGNTFRGHVTFNAGNGTNFSNPSNAIGLPENSFAGNFTYLGGNGSDFLVLAQPHAGNFTALLGDGNNEIITFGVSSRGEGLPLPELFVAGNMMVKGGTGADLATPFFATINGNLSFDLGAGSNTVNIQANVAGTVRYTGGAGVDTVEVGGANAYALFVTLGAGNDSFTFSDDTTVGSASIDFGFGDDTYTDNGVIVFWTFSLRNL